VLTYEHTIEALADPTRRRIVEQLARGPSSVGELAQALPVSRPAVSQHMRVLLEAGLVSYRSQGTRNVYRLEPAGFDTLRIWLDGFWRDVLDAFETYADEQSIEREEHK
jgi:DNA-binding transcriptional ArsR family regulator